MAKIQVLECVLLSLGFIKVEVRPYKPCGLLGVGDVSLLIDRWPETTPFKDVVIGEKYDRMVDVTLHAEVRCPLDTEWVYVSPRLHDRGESQKFRSKAEKILGAKALQTIDHSTYAEPCPHSFVAINLFNVEVR